MKKIINKLLKCNMAKVVFFCATLLIFFVGCSSSLNSSFDCSMKPGVVCQSLDQVNSMVDKGQLGKTNISCSNGKCQDISNISKVSLASNFSTPYPSNLKIGEPLRYGESVTKIWVAPYEDDVGNYHTDNVIYTVVKKGYWIANPPKGEVEE